MKKFLIILSILMSPFISVSSSSAGEVLLHTFVNTHARFFEAQAERYKKEVDPNFNLTIVEVPYGQLYDQVTASLASGGLGAPDIVDMEQGAFGRFLLGGNPGFVDMNSLRTSACSMDDFVSSRLSLYTWDGITYGYEHALTPVVYYYHTEPFEKAGIDPADIKTWDEWSGIMKEMGVAGMSITPSYWHLLLKQAGTDYFDADGNVTINSELSISILEWMKQQYDDGTIILQPDGAAQYAVHRDGDVIGNAGADWYGGFFRDNLPELEGKMKAAPLPAWKEGGSRTSVFGGTAPMIVKTSKNIDEAYKFIEFAQCSVEGAVSRYQLTTLFPPFYPAMDDERLLKPDPYFSNQVLGKVFREIAPKIPKQYQSPYRTFLEGEVGKIFNDIMEGVISPADAANQIADKTKEEIDFNS